MLVDFTAVLARLLTRHGNRIGAILYDGETHRAVPAGGGRIQVLHVMRELLAQPRLDHAPAIAALEKARRDADPYVAESARSGLSTLGPAQPKKE